MPFPLNWPLSSHFHLPHRIFPYQLDSTKDFLCYHPYNISIIRWSNNNTIHQSVTNSTCFLFCHSVCQTRVTNKYMTDQWSLFTFHGWPFSSIVDHKWTNRIITKYFFSQRCACQDKLSVLYMPTKNIQTIDSL